MSARKKPFNGYTIIRSDRGKRMLPRKISLRYNC